MTDLGEPADERFDLVDEQGAIIGSALRGEVHGDPSLLHPVVHCVVFDASSALLLQLRAGTKRVQPGRWDLSVGGHVAQGEQVEAALAREMAEEIGVDATAAQPRFLYRYLWRTDFESELIYTYACRWDGPVRRQESEIDELRFWTLEEIAQQRGQGVFTPNLLEELSRLRAGDHLP
jgi:isopentenyldiphosphate isomerase